MKISNISNHNIIWVVYAGLTGFIAEYRWFKCDFDIFIYLYKSQSVSRFILFYLTDELKKFFK